MLSYGCKKLSEIIFFFFFKCIWNIEEETEICNYYLIDTASKSAIFFFYYGELNCI